MVDRFSIVGVSGLLSPLCHTYKSYKLASGEGVQESVIFEPKSVLPSAGIILVTAAGGGRFRILTVTVSLNKQPLYPKASTVYVVSVEGETTIEFVVSSVDHLRYS